MAIHSSMDYPIHSHKVSLLLGTAIVLITAMHWLILLFEIPVLTALPFWFFPFRDQAIGLGWIALAAGALLAATAISYSRLQISARLTALVLLGVIIQFSFAFSKGHGLDGIRDRIVSTGHAELALVAAKQTDLLKVANNYEAMAESGKLGSFAQSKPPGTLFFYMVSEKLANISADTAAADATGADFAQRFIQRLEALRTFASVAWPWLTYLVLVPIYFIARKTLDSNQAIAACLLYLSIPSVNLITLHLDQFLFPLLAVTPVVFAIRAIQNNSFWHALLSGINLYLAAYFSFALMTISITLLVLFAFAISSGLISNWQSALKPSGGVLLGIASADGLARLLMNYDVANRYVHAISFHEHWKLWDSSLTTLLQAGLTNIVEFSVWLGVPLSIMLIAAMAFSFYQTFATKKISFESVFPLALGLTFLFLVLFGKTKSETARLWMFLIPFICIGAANFIYGKILPENRRRHFMLMLLFLQFGTNYLTLLHQDFY